MGLQDHMDGDGKFRTRDLPLAAYLTLNGHDHIGMEKRGRIGYWVFNRNPELDQLVKTYGKGHVCLNLKAFMDCVADVRSDLYSYLGIN